MVYASHSTLSDITNCTFDQRDDNQPGTPIDVTALEFNDVSIGQTNGLDILDNFEYGIYGTDCDELHIGHLHFGSEYINVFHPTHFYDVASPRSLNGIYLKECTNIIIAGATIQAENTGIQFYLDMGSSVVPSPTPTSTSLSTINSCEITLHGSIGRQTAGIIIAPDENPLTNTNPSVNSSTIPIKLDIECTRIQGWQYGIVGSGIKTDWVSTVGYLGTPAPNDPAIEFTSIQEWPIIWSENITWTSSNQMKYYTASPYTDPLIEVSSAPSFPVLDGTTIANGNYNITPMFDGPFDGPAVTATNGVQCLPSWVRYKKDPLSIDDLKKTNVSAYPNPFRNNLNLSLNGKSIDLLEVYNSLGERVTSFASPTNEVELSTESWTSGVYFIILTGTNERSSIKAVKY
jgi:hypothetical protein